MIWCYGRQSKEFNVGLSKTKLVSQRKRIKKEREKKKRETVPDDNDT